MLVFCEPIKRIKQNIFVPFFKKVLTRGKVCLIIQLKNLLYGKVAAGGETPHGRRVGKNILRDKEQRRENDL